MNWLSQNWQSVWDLLILHLSISATAVIAATLLAIPIGRFAFQHPVIGGTLLSATTLIYAIPSLPLIVIIPIVIGTPIRAPVTIIVALSLYGLALLVRTAADAFDSVDPNVRQAAQAIGFSRRNLLWKVDMPLALPVFISGVRVVTMSTVGLVTIGSVVGISSLGSLLTDGYERGIMAEVATGIIATVVLALVLDALILLLGRVLAPWTAAVERSGA
ncbi:MAG: ABC transporter permease subunit [Actinomycetaceae bacterium]|nr:ABC transporter permease subunit [Actinomycetaceae bacterium]